MQCLYRSILDSSDLSILENNLTSISWNLWWNLQTLENSWTTLCKNTFLNCVASFMNNWSIIWFCIRIWIWRFWLFIWHCLRILFLNNIFRGELLFNSLKYLFESLFCIFLNILCLFHSLHYFLNIRHLLILLPHFPYAPILINHCLFALQESCLSWVILFHLILKELQPLDE